MIKRHHLKDTAPQTAAIENVVQRSCTYKSQMFIKKKSPRIFLWYTTSKFPLSCPAMHLKVITFMSKI